MDVLRFDGLTRAYGAREVFGELAGVVRDGQTIGLVGPNGAGKSSLVRILAGLEAPDGGSLVRARDVRLGYLSQAANADDGGTLRTLLAQAFERFHAAEARLRELEEALSSTEDAEALEKMLHAYGEAREAFDRHGGDAIERRMRSMLAAFDFDEEDLDRQISSFSGGQRTRASLARLLLEEPDYLILDEPTNHLDLETVRWLEEFLIGDHRATLVVSHDRFFLDRVANEIWELDGGTLSTYAVPRGRGYEAYLVEKAERLALAQRKYDAFKEEEKRRKDVVAELRTHGSHNYSHVKSREKQLAKMERVEAPKSSQASISVKLDAARRATTGLAVEVKGLTKSFGGPALFSNLSFSIARGERIALVGPNGAGKSTLLEMLAGRIPPDSGSVKVFEGVKTAFFAQDSSDDLAPDQSAVDAVRNGPGVTDQAARALLGRLGLGGDAAEKPVGAFSGGERRRIMLARLMARSADLLFLDEPTNDLDIPSRESLESVLASYGGAMLVVSHDRYLLRRLAERVLWLHDGGATFVQGGYERFEELVRTGATKDPAALKNGTSTSQSPKSGADKATKAKGSEKSGTGSNGKSAAGGTSQGASASDSKRLKALASAEREVARLDEERVRLELEFADPNVYDDRARVADLERELASNRAGSDAALARWEALSEEPAIA